MGENRKGNSKITGINWLLWGIIFVVPLLFYPFAVESQAISNSYIHGMLEFWGASIAFSVTGLILLHYFASGRKIFLWLSIAFTAQGGEDLVHALFSFSRLWANIPPHLATNLPDNYVAGRFILITGLIFAVLFGNDLVKARNKLKKVIFLNSLAVLITVGITISPLYIQFPAIKVINGFIRHPSHLLSALMYGIGIILYIRAYADKKNRTPLMWCMIVSLIIGLNAQIYMMNSQHSFDIQFSISHILKTLSYFFPIFGIGIGMFSLYKREGELVKRLSSSVKRERTLAAKAAIADLERQRADELLKINKELDNFSYVVSHDLRAPLRAVKSFATFLVEDYKPVLPDEAQDYIDEICKGTERMNTLLDDLLALSRISRINNPYTTIDTSKVVFAVTKLLEFDIKQNNVQIKTPKQLPHIYCDPIKLELVFSNLIKNAIKFSSDNSIPIIEITYTEKPDEHEFAIKDNGIGIDPKYNSQIFELFKRLHPSDEYEGTGVGLSIVKKIIDEHNGAIWVESELNKGAEFFFTISKNLQKHTTTPLQEPSSRRPSNV